MRKMYLIQEKKEILDKVDKLVAGGIDKNKAIEKCNIGSMTYYRWKNQSDNGVLKRKRPRLVFVPEKQEIVNQINELINNGVATYKACEKFNIPTASYYKWKKEKSNEQIDTPPLKANSFIDCKATSNKTSNQYEKQLIFNRINKLLDSGIPLEEAIRKCGITEFTYYDWRRNIESSNSLYKLETEIKELKDKLNRTEIELKTIKNLYFEKFMDEEVNKYISAHKNKQ